MCLDKANTQHQQVLKDIIRNRSSLVSHNSRYTCAHARKIYVEYLDCVRQISRRIRSSHPMRPGKEGRGISPIPCFTFSHAQNASRMHGFCSFLFCFWSWHFVGHTNLSNEWVSENSQNTNPSSVCNQNLQNYYRSDDLNEMELLFIALPCRRAFLEYSFLVVCVRKREIEKRNFPFVSSYHGFCSRNMF